MRQNKIKLKKKKLNPRLLTIHKANVLCRPAQHSSPLRTAQHPQQDLVLSVAMVAKVERVRL